MSGSSDGPDGAAGRPPGPGGRGRVNAHTHLYSGLVPLGMPAPTPAPKDFPELLERVWWRLDRALDAQSLRASARYYVAQALLAGTTAVVDHHESPEFIDGSLDVLADACEELGMRALLCYGASERNGGRDEAARGLAECRRFLSSNRRELVRGAVGLHAGFTVSDETLREAGALAREFDTVVHVHVAEDACDVEDARRRGYSGALDRLLRMEALPEGSILAHGVHLTGIEVCLAAEHGLWFVQNPRSNVANGVGYPHALDATARVALGTDGFPADMTDEVELALRGAAQHNADLDRAGARLDRGEELVAPHLGSIEVELAQGELRVAGRTVATAGALVTAEIEDITREAREQARRLWRRMEDLE